MVKLTDDYQAKADEFKAAGIAVPQFDQEQMKQATQANPVWVHFGGGNSSAASMRKLRKTY